MTTEEFAAYIGSEIVADEPFLDDCLAAAEDAVNDFCGRSFDAPSGDSSTRVYVPKGNLLYTHDFVDTSGLAVSNAGAAVTSSDYQLEPLNNLTPAGLTTPYYSIRLLSSCWSQMYPGEASVSVSSTRWGWPAVPPKVKEATAILAKDIAHMREIRFGVTGFGEFASARLRENPQVQSMLSRLRHPWAFGIAGGR